MAKLKLTKASIDRLPFTLAGQNVFWDTELRGFGLVVGMQTKSFIVQTNVFGQAVRVTLGQFGLHSTDEYRERARKQLGKLKDGINPREEEKQRLKAEAMAKASAITLRHAFHSLETAKSAKLNPQTLKDYKAILVRFFSDWLDNPIKDITPVMVQVRHSEIRKRIADRRKNDRNQQNRGEAHANGAMRVLRAVYNFALVTFEDTRLPANPVNKLSKTRSWFKDRRRQTIVQPHQLPSWYKAVNNLEDPLSPELAKTTREFLLLLLFTGLRRMEAATLTWDRVDLIGRTITIANTKNHEPHVLPIPKVLVAILSNRKQAAEEGGQTSPYVFPWSSVREGHILYPVRYLEEICKESGVHFTPHDLRRTFITTAEGLDLSTYAVKKLVNHKMSDVTSGYMVFSVERLRRPMEQISEYLLSAASVNPLCQILPLELARSNQLALAV